MIPKKQADVNAIFPLLSTWPIYGKVFATIVIIMMAMGLGMAVVQITVHDVIPTLWGEDSHKAPFWAANETADETTGYYLAHGGQKDTHSDPISQNTNFIFALKFTHIHIFGMSAIFIIMGALVLFLDTTPTKRIWLIVLPFIGIIIDLTSVWLKLFVHPIFFWLHIPGGVLFGTVFAVDAVLVLRQALSRTSMPSK